LAPHGCVDDVADGEDVGQVCAHLDVYVDEATVGDCRSGRYDSRIHHFTL
jgi:hypothetical protein